MPLVAVSWQSPVLSPDQLAPPMVTTHHSLCPSSGQFPGSEFDIPAYVPLISVRCDHRACSDAVWEMLLLVLVFKQLKRFRSSSEQCLASDSGQGTGVFIGYPLKLYAHIEQL